MYQNSQEAVLPVNIGWVLSVCMNVDGSRIVSGNWDRKVRIWNMHRNSEEAVLSGHKGYALSVCMSGDERWIVSRSFDDTVRI